MDCSDLPNEEISFETIFDDKKEENLIALALKIE